MDEAAAILHLEDFLERRPKALSGGQRQRVAMGRAIVRSPQAFLMDEPLSNLDAKLRVEMRLEIARIQRLLGVATVYVTHDQVEAMTMGDRVAVLRDGKLQQVDTPQDLYDRPANEFVAGFMGSPPMNLIRCQPASGTDRVEVVLGRPGRSNCRWSYTSSHALPAAGRRRRRRRAARRRHRHRRVESRTPSRRASSDSEALGAEILVHLSSPRRVDNRARSTRDDHLATRDAGGEDGATRKGRSPATCLCVQLSPEHVHFFDAETGQTRCD